MKESQKLLESADIIERTASNIKNGMISSDLLSSILESEAKNIRRQAVSIGQLSGSEIRSLRLKKGLTQIDASFIAGVSLSKFRQWESEGITELKVDEAKFIYSMLVEKEFSK